MIRAASLLDSFVALEALGQEFFNAITSKADIRLLRRVGAA